MAARSFSGAEVATTLLALFWLGWLGKALVVLIEAIDERLSGGPPLPLVEVAKTRGLRGLVLGELAKLVFRECWMPWTMEV